MFIDLYFIADIGANHDGELDRAYKLIEQAADAGAHAAKFQNYTAAGLVSNKGFSGPQKGHQASWTKSVYDTYNDAAINPDWTPLLRAKCDEVGIDYFTSAYSFEEVDAVDPYVKYFKIGSGDITYHQLIRHIASKGKPVLLATGAAMWDEVRDAVQIVLAGGVPLVLMQCNTNYTGSIENFKYLNLNVLQTYEDYFYTDAIGFSDHTPGHVAVLGAVALGATVIEKHFTDDRSRPGNDHAFAIEPSEWRQMVYDSNLLYIALGDGRKRIENNEMESAYVQKRALRYKHKLPAGYMLSMSDFKVVRPEEGLRPYEADEIIGKRLIAPVEADDPVDWGDVLVC